MQKEIVISLELHESILKKTVQSAVISAITIAILGGIAIGGSISMMVVAYQLDEKQIELNKILVSYDELVELTKEK